MLFSANFRFSFEANFSRTLKSEYFSWDLIFSFWSRLQKFSNFEKIFSSCVRSTSVVKSADFKSFSFSFYFYGSLVYHLRRLFPVKLSGNSLSLRFWAFFVKLSFFFSNSGLVWVREGKESGSKKEARESFWWVSAFNFLVLYFPIGYLNR